MPGVPRWAYSFCCKNTSTEIHINDLSQPVYSFWKAVLNNTEELCRLIKKTRLSVASWDRQKQIFANPRDHSYVEIGFAVFF